MPPQEFQTYLIQRRRENFEEFSNFPPMQSRSEMTGSARDFKLTKKDMLNTSFKPSETDLKSVWNISRAQIEADL